jgi:hypothetical protein
MTSLHVKDQGVWHEIKGAPAALPGLGGWADITAVTGNPTKHQYKDAAGVDWVAYEWTASGSMTTTEGLVDLFAISGGSGSIDIGVTGAKTGPGGGSVREGVIKIPAGAQAITVGAGGADSGGGAVGLGHESLVGDVVNTGRGMVHYATGDYLTGPKAGPDSSYLSSITGTAVGYGKVSNRRSGFGDAYASGTVIVRVPRANAQA